jgi:hypothetical protein
MSAGDYLAGVVFFLPTVAASLAAAVIVLRRRWGYLSGLPRALGFCVVATAALVFVHVVPAALGVLARGTVLLTALVVLAAASAVRPAREAARSDSVPRPPASSAASVTIAALALVALVVYELARARVLLGAPLTDIDMLGFHLPGVARWIQTGTVWQVDQFLPGFATAQYPNNGDFLILATVLPWHSLAFARFPGVVFFVLTGVGVYALALELGASRAAATTFAALALLVLPLSHFALEGLPDDVAESMLLLGSLFLIRHARTRRSGELVLGGLALGLALGTKWFGLTACAVIVVVWVAARVIARERPGRLARDGGLLLAMVSVGGGFWLVRNLVESGNPLYPKAISVLGVKLFAGSRGDLVDRLGYTIAHYLGDPHVLRRFIYPGFRSELGLSGLVLLIGLVIALAWSVRWRREPRAAAVLIVALVTVGIFATYVITPGTAYGPKNYPVQGYTTLRWLVPAVVIGAAVAAAGARAVGRWGIVLELAALAGVIDAINRGDSVPGSAVVQAVLLLAAVAAVAVIVGRRLRARRPRRTFTRGFALTATALAVLIVAGRVQEHQFDSRSYAPYDPVFAWTAVHAPAGYRIGLTGTTGGTPGLSPVLPLFGPRLGNVVGFVGDRVVHSLETPAHESSFLRELRGGRYELLAIGLPYPGETDIWARSLGFRLLARSSRIALYAIPRGVRS